jgi:hypothetical protein
VGAGTALAHSAISAAVGTSATKGTRVDGGEGPARIGGGAPPLATAAGRLSPLMLADELGLRGVAGGSGAAGDGGCAGVVGAGRDDDGVPIGVAAATAEVGVEAAAAAAAAARPSNLRRSASRRTRSSSLGDVVKGCRVGRPAAGARRSEAIGVALVVGDRGELVGAGPAAGAVVGLALAATGDVGEAGVLDSVMCSCAGEARPRARRRAAAADRVPGPSPGNQCAYMMANMEGHRPGGRRPPPPPPAPISARSRDALRS